MPTPTDAPTITNNGSTVYGVVGGQAALQIIATQYPTFYTMSQTPPGLGFDAVRGLASGVLVGPARMSIQVTARNAIGTAVGTINFVGSDGRVLIPDQVLTARAGDTINYQVRTEGPYGGNDWRAGGLPPGLSFGLVGGIPYVKGVCNAAGTYDCTITAGNPKGYTISQLTVSILEANGTPNPPAGATPVVADGAFHALMGQAITDFQVGLSGGAYRQLGVAGLPAGLSMSGSGLITGTPTVTGTFHATVTATNTAGTDTGTITVTVDPGDGGDDSGGDDDAGDTSPNIVITWDMVTGATNVVNGSPSAYLGEQKTIEVHILPKKYAGSVTNLSYTFKEANQPLQHRTLLPQQTATGTGGTNVYTFPATTFDGDALRYSLMLLDATASPSLAVQYDLALACNWNGNPRKSNPVGFILQRPEDLDPGSGPVGDSTNPVIDENAPHEFTHILPAALIPGRSYTFGLGFGPQGAFTRLDYTAMLTATSDRLVIVPDYGAQKLFRCGWVLTLLPDEQGDPPPGGYTGIPAPISVTAHLFGKPWIDAETPDNPVWDDPALIQGTVPTTTLYQSPNGSLFNFGPDDNGAPTFTPA